MSFRITKIRQLFALAFISVLTVSAGVLFAVPPQVLAAVDPYVGAQFNWDDPKTISVSSSALKDKFALDGDSGITYLRSGQSGGCKDTIEIDETDSSKGTLTPKSAVGTGACSPTAQPKTITIADATKGAPTGGVKGGAAGEKTCEDYGKLMGFIMCPSITIIDSGMGLVDRLIMNLLEVKTDPIQQDKFKQAWGNIRDLAFIITVPIMLVMVIGTALGFEFISAYTVKKSLPRLILAIIFISLSLQICTFLIGLSNSIGQATLGFMTFPFGKELGSAFTPEGNDLMNIILDGPEKVAGFAVLIVGLILFLWLFGTTLLIAAGIGFLVLLFRQILIIFLVLLAPLAILAWVFPGNDKLWKTWWGLFSKLLIMYPLIMALIAAGRIFAFVIGGGK